MNEHSPIDMIRKYQDICPVDVLGIAHELKIEVYKATSNEIEFLSGKILKDPKRGGESGYAIFVNAQDNLFRQRFTIAHEIAHFILHKELIGDGLVDDALYRSGLSTKEEAMANKLAADILMPWHLLNSVMDDHINSIDQLAKIFHVSESAMSIRLGIPS